jgi:putative FmdB family regulatory protein
MTPRALALFSMRIILCYYGGMPSYDFRCPACGAEVSVVASVSDVLSPVCAQCVVPLVRVFGLGGVSFSGSGFYSTDK